MTRVTDSGSGSRQAFFEGFSWPVPFGFESAVSALQFDAGDVLHSDPSGYGSWSAGPPAGLMTLQVLKTDPVRNASVEGSEGDRRLTAWSAQVVVARHGPASGEREVLELTQGRLFTALWRGDSGWLEPGDEVPPPPRTARELQQELEAAAPGFDAAGLTAKKGGGCRFLFVIDRASAASRSKASQIDDALRGRRGVKGCVLSPIQAGVPDAEAFHPTLEIHGLLLPGLGEDEVHAALRDALYVGSADGDRFSVSRHGRLEVL